MTLEQHVGLPIFLIPNRCHFFLYVPSTEEEKNILWYARQNQNNTWRSKGRGLISGEHNAPKRKKAQSKRKGQAMTSPESLMAPRRKHAPRSQVGFACKCVTTEVIWAVGELQELARKQVVAVLVTYCTCHNWWNLEIFISGSRTRDFRVQTLGFAAGAKYQNEKEQPAAEWLKPSVCTRNPVFDLRR